MFAALKVCDFDVLAKFADLMARNHFRIYSNLQLTGFYERYDKTIDIRPQTYRSIPVLAKSSMNVIYSTARGNLNK